MLSKTILSIFLLVISATCISAQEVYSDLLVLKNGTKIKCRILKQDADNVTIINEKGSKANCSMELVAYIQYGKTNTETVENGTTSRTIKQATKKNTHARFLFTATLGGLIGVGRFNVGSPVNASVSNKDKFVTTLFTIGARIKKKVDVSLGFGIDALKSRYMIPIGLNIRYLPIIKPLAPYFSIFGGYAPAVVQGNSNNYGGGTFLTSIGLRYAFKKEPIEINIVEVGYRLQQFKFYSRYTYQLGVWNGTNGVSYIGNYIFIKAGLSFN